MWQRPVNNNVFTTPCVSSLPTCFLQMLPLLIQATASGKSKWFCKWFLHFFFYLTKRFYISYLFSKWYMVFCACFLAFNTWFLDVSGIANRFQYLTQVRCQCKRSCPETWPDIAINHQPRNPKTEPRHCSCFSAMILFLCCHFRPRVTKKNSWSICSPHFMCSWIKCRFVGFPRRNLLINLFFTLHVF